MRPEGSVTLQTVSKQQYYPRLSPSLPSSWFGQSWCHLQFKYVFTEREHLFKVLLPGKYRNKNEILLTNCT